MFGTIQKNSALWNAQALNDDYGKMCVAFPDILEEVREEMAGLCQVPEFTNPSDECFPVYAVARPTTRVINGGSSLVGIIND